MRKERVFVISERNLKLVRFIGSFMVFGALIMILYSAALMFESWGAVKHYSMCMDSAKADYASMKKIASAEQASGVSELEVLAQLRYMECREALYKTTGIYPSKVQTELSIKQTFIAFVKPLGLMFFWAVVFFLGLILYNCRTLSISMEEISHGEAKSERHKA